MRAAVLLAFATGTLASGECLSPAALHGAEAPAEAEAPADPQAASVSNGCRSIGSTIARKVGGILEERDGWLPGAEPWAWDISFRASKGTVGFVCKEDHVILLGNLETSPSRVIAVARGTVEILTGTASREAAEAPQKCIRAAKRTRRRIGKVGKATARLQASIPYFVGEVKLGSAVLSCSYEYDRKTLGDLSFTLDRKRTGESR